MRLNRLPVVDAMQVETKTGIRSTPGQLVYKDDVLVASPDLWLTETYCDKRSTDSNITRRVSRTPAASQLLDLLNNHDTHKHESFFDRQYNECMLSVRMMLIASLLLSVVVSSSHLILTDHRRFFEFLLVRHVNVCLPLLPLSISLLSLLLKVGSNAYLSAMIHQLQQSTSPDFDANRNNSRAFTAQVDPSATTKRQARQRTLNKPMSLQSLWKVPATPLPLALV